MDEDTLLAIAARVGVEPDEITGATRDEAAHCWIVEARGEEFHVVDEPQ